MTRLLPLLILLAGCAHQDEWTQRDTSAQLMVTAVILADAITTNRIQDNPYAEEVGPVARHFLGPQPNTDDTALYFGTVIITSYLVSRALPARWRRYWQWWEIGAHGYALKNSCDAGLC